jgi:hypothetical protein
LFAVDRFEDVEASGPTLRFGALAASLGKLVALFRMCTERLQRILPFTTTGEQYAMYAMVHLLIHARTMVRDDG